MKSSHQFSSLPKAYIPSEYAFLGFLFSLVPVFIMSFSNMKVLHFTEEMKRKMKFFCGIFIALFVTSILILTWAVYATTVGLKDYVRNNPGAGMKLMMSSYGIDKPDFSGIGGQFQLALTVQKNASTILFVMNLILLVVVISHTNKHELPIYKKMLDDKKIQGKSMLVPVLAGIAFTAALYWGIPWYAEFIARVFV